MTGGTHPAPDSTPGSCRYCHTPAYRSDANGPVHTCCLAWRKVIEDGYRCPSCQVAQNVMRQPVTWPDGTSRPVRLPRLPSLPHTLPDGSPFVPEITRPEKNIPEAAREAASQPEAQP